MVLADMKIKKVMRKKKTFAHNAVKVAELFAGVGGFRLGLEKVKNDEKEVLFKTVWANQWEPATLNTQHAATVYRNKFKPSENEFVVDDIAKVDADSIPEHTLLVGGFPCQDYSVARTLNQAAGIVGKKGVLWWEINRILKRKKKPEYLFLENVDRLLKSPAGQRGRDFAIMLSSLNDLGYAVEWRVINAAEYGFPQRRRRVFFIGYHKGTPTYDKIKRLLNKEELKKWILSEGVTAKAFPAKDEAEIVCPVEKIDPDVFKVSESFNKGNVRRTPFLNSGVMIDGKYMTFHVERKRKIKGRVLGDVLEKGPVDPAFYVAEKDFEKWKKLKGPKSIPRKNKEGFMYCYEEGGMIFPDPKDRPSRTIVTGEGGSTPSRFKHVVEDVTGRKRRLTPVELERLNGFPRNFTKHKDISDTKRAFFMGNALVVGVVNKIGKELAKEILLSK